MIRRAVHVRRQRPVVLPVSIFAVRGGESSSGADEHIRRCRRGVGVEVHPRARHGTASVEIYRPARTGTACDRIVGVVVRQGAGGQLQFRLRRVDRAAESVRRVG